MPKDKSAPRNRLDFYCPGERPGVRFSNIKQFGNGGCRVNDLLNKHRNKRDVWIEADLFNSSAFRSISNSGSTIITLMKCFQKCRWKLVKISNRKKQREYTDDGFIFPYAEAADLKIAKKTQHWKNMSRLMEVGFIDLVHQGGWYRKHEKVSDYSVYKYSQRWRKYGTPEFIKFEKTKVLPEHFHVRANIERQKLKVTSLQRTSRVHSNEHDRPTSSNRCVHDSEHSNQASQTHQTLAVIT